MNGSIILRIAQAFTTIIAKKRPGSPLMFLFFFSLHFTMISLFLDRQTLQCSLQVLFNVVV